LWTLSSLLRIDFDLNELTGSIQSEIGNLRLLEFFDVDANKLTGTLPNEFTNLTNLKFMDISGNRFKGQIPETLWKSNIEQLFLFLNNVTGTVPDDFCGEGKRIRIDDDIWFNKAKVNCTCCMKRKCSMWDLNQEEVEHVQCPIANINPFAFEGQYEAKDKVAGEEMKRAIADGASEANMCLSPTGCYDFKIQTIDFSFRRISTNVSIGYKIGAEQLQVYTDGICDPVDVCGESIGEEHAKRAGLNHLTQLAAPDLSQLSDATSAGYKALCDVITKDDMYEEYQVCDGTLLQRYVLLFFYYSMQLDFNFLDLATNHTCEWPGVSCDSTEKFIKRIDLSSKDLRGSIVTEIGLLKSLQEIDLSNNTIVGTIDPMVYMNIQDLKVVRVGKNKLGGTFPREMLEFQNLTEFNISGNLFVGTLPENLSYPQELSKLNTPLIRVCEQ